jgi:hypothetical protein
MRRIDLIPDRRAQNEQVLGRLASAADDLLRVLPPDDQRLLCDLGEEHQWPIVAMMLGAMAIAGAFPRGL